MFSAKWIVSLFSIPSWRYETDFWLAEMKHLANESYCNSEKMALLKTRCSIKYCFRIVINSWQEIARMQDFKSFTSRASGALSIPKTVRAPRYVSQYCFQFFKIIIENINLCVSGILTHFSLFFHKQKVAHFLYWLKDFKMSIFF